MRRDRALKALATAGHPTFRDSQMNLYQWLLSFALDFILKAGCMYLVSAFTLGRADLGLHGDRPGQVGVSFFLPIARLGFIDLFEWTRKRHFALMLLVANILFAACLSLWLWYPRSENSGCPPDQCHWPYNDAVTDRLWIALVITLIFLVFNLLPILFSKALGSLASRMRARLSGQHVL